MSDVQLGRTLTYLPWMKLSCEVRIGDVYLSPAPAFLRSNTLEPDVQTWLESYVKIHRETDLKPFDGGVFCSLHGQALDLTPEQAFGPVQRAVDALFLSSVGRTCQHIVTCGQTMVSPPSTGDEYAVVLQKFNPRIRAIAVSAGNNIGEHTLENLTIVAPWHLKLDDIISRDDCQRDLLGMLLNRENTGAARAANWFRLAHCGGDSVSRGSRLVMLMTGFEALLGADDQDIGALELAKRLDSLIETAVGSSWRYKKWSRPYRGKSPGHTAPAGIFLRLYEQRNSVIHGNAAPQLTIEMPNDIKVPSYCVASALLWQACLMEGVERKCFDATASGISADLLAKGFDLNFAGEYEQIFVKSDLLDFHRSNARVGWCENVSMSASPAAPIDG